MTKCAQTGVRGALFPRSCPRTYYAGFRSRISNFIMTPELLYAAIDGQPLTESQSQAAMAALLAGEASPSVIAAFLTALRIKGETVQELAGFARAMRAGRRPSTSTTLTGRSSTIAARAAMVSMPSIFRPSPRSWWRAPVFE